MPGRWYFLRYLPFVLIDLVVINLYVEYWDKVVIDSFTITLFTACVMQLLLKLTIALEHRVAEHFKAKPGKSALWNLAAQNLDVLVICYNNGGSAALEMELARVRRAEAQKKSLDMVHIRKPHIDYAGMAETMGVPATRVDTAEESHEQFAQAMQNKGPRFIDAKIVSNLPMLVKMVRGDRP